MNDTNDKFTNPMPTSFRAFFAIGLSPELEKQITEIVAKLRKDPICRNLKWTKPKNLHITLRFLGNITTEHFINITRDLAPLLQQIPVFSIKFTELMPFPNPDFPIVLVLKPRPLIDLTALEIAIDNCVNKYGVKMEKRSFNPHLTLARIKNKLPPEKFHKALSKIVLPDLLLHIDSVKLIRSEPSPLGSNYTTLATFMLKTEN